MAASTLYVVFFAIASLFTRQRRPSAAPSHRSSFLILYPAYHEDAVIITSIQKFLQQTYPADLYHVAVISDHMMPETNQQLRAFPITVHTPAFEKSSKAKALQYALDNTPDVYDYVVILDADNVVRPDFLMQLNAVCQQGHQAIQCHRCAKNADNDIAVLDGVSEEINNTLFRKAHNTVGLSSALIGSGMCFRFDWFRQHVGALNSAVEDRELETMLAKENIFVKYEEDIHVFDEKVSNADNFQRQRLRWMTGQVQSLILMLPYVPTALVKGNINYIDKTVQQALIPRSILIVLTVAFSLLSTLIACFALHSLFFTLKWWALLLLLALSLLTAMPAPLRSRAVIGRLTKLPHLVWRMMANVGKIDHKNKEFIHTTHNK